MSKLVPIWLYSRLYSSWSKFLHKHGYHYTGKLIGPNSKTYWCQWCGLCGTVTTKADLDRAAREMDALSKQHILHKGGE